MASLSPSDDAWRIRSSGGPALRGYRSAWSKCRSGRGWFARCAGRLRSRPCAWRRSDAACGDWRGVPLRGWPCRPLARRADELDDGRRQPEIIAARSFSWQSFHGHFSSIAVTLAGRALQAEPSALCRPYRGRGCIPYRVSGLRAWHRQPRRHAPLRRREVRSWRDRGGLARECGPFRSTDAFRSAWILLRRALAPWAELSTAWADRC